MATVTRFYIGCVDKVGHRVDQGHFVEAEAILDSQWGGFTCYDTAGQWQGKGELSRMYECINVQDYLSFEIMSVRARRVAKDLARICNQSSVLWTMGECEGGFESC